MVPGTFAHLIGTSAISNVPHDVVKIDTEMYENALF